MGVMIMMNKQAANTISNEEFLAEFDRAMAYVLGATSSPKISKTGKPEFDVGRAMDYIFGDVVTMPQDNVVTFKAKAEPSYTSPEICCGGSGSGNRGYGDAEDGCPKAHGHISVSVQGALFDVESFIEDAKTLIRKLIQAYSVESQFKASLNSGVSEESTGLDETYGHRLN